MKKIEMFLDMMFHTADQAHLWHLQTKSYALHKALNGYYDDVRDQLDAVAEEYMGYSGSRLEAKSRLPLTAFKDSAQVQKHLESICMYLTDLNNEIMKNDKNATHLINAIDVLRETVAKTKYLVTLS